MIVENKFIKEFGNPPQKIKELAKLAFNHGKSFSQGDKCIFVKFNVDDDVWTISDNYCRGAYKSICFNVSSKTFYAYSEKTRQKALYNKEITCLTHAKQFFMPGLVDSLFKEHY